MQQTQIKPDKSILEAMACGTIPLVCNESFHDLLPKELFFKEGDAQDLALSLELLFTLHFEQRDKISEELHKKVQEKHSLEKLVSDIVRLVV